MSEYIESFVPSIKNTMSGQYFTIRCSICSNVRSAVAPDTLVLITRSSVLPKSSLTYFSKSCATPSYPFVCAAACVMESPIKSHVREQLFSDAICRMDCCNEDKGGSFAISRGAIFPAALINCAEPSADQSKSSYSFPEGRCSTVNGFPDAKAEIKTPSTDSVYRNPASFG